MREHLPDGEQAVAHDIEEHKSGRQMRVAACRSR
jgi:hypothetical protein